jgi:hypothetical protein
VKVLRERLSNWRIPAPLSSFAAQTMGMAGSLLDRPRTRVELPPSSGDVISHPP